MAELKNAARLGDAYAQTMNIWIGRFGEAQKAIRELETIQTQVLMLAEKTDVPPDIRIGAIIELLRGDTEEPPEDEHAGHSHA